ncbi:sensor histidine kinase [Alkaliphilus oremlandii]|uniref:histidine kinase n=1 Tax=Alkaliphilus oremlandii (strain OhILAs) TaxID=350688 RepID=A8MHJ1_ALKOO|nr:ATP-binding protein [Alkaliphilus oremlandii]ABW19273.1 histidine kinase [Alkaliphilus oremlandii OhILAs]
MLIINVFVHDSIKNNLINGRIESTLSQASIISNIVSAELEDGHNKRMQINDIDLESILQKIATEFKGRILIIDLQKKVIFDSFHELRLRIINQKEVSDALKGMSITGEYWLDKYGDTMYTAVPIHRDGNTVGAVLLSTSLAHCYGEIGAIRDKLILISTLVLLAIVATTLRVANSISEPIKRLTQVMQNAAHGKLNEKVIISGENEISQLAKAYNFMNTKLSHIEEQRREFVGNVSHELKTPLSSMKLLSESLLIQPEVDVSIYKEFLKDIDSEINRLTKIIDSLLNLVDMDEEKLSIDYKLTYLNYLIEKVVNSIKPLAHEKNIEIIFGQWEKIQIYVDQDKIHQALTNIIYNAVKYTENNGKIEIGLFKKGNYAVIKISDTGIGIAEENIPHLFERFYRVDSARSRETGGTGLGLTISQQVISLHQGTIEVESVVNEGTTFYVKLPIEYMLGDKN